MRRGPTCSAGWAGGPDAAAAYERALALATNAAERAFLARRLGEVRAAGWPGRPTARARPLSQGPRPPLARRLSPPLGRV